MAERTKAAGCNPAGINPTEVRILSRPPFKEKNMEMKCPKCDNNMKEYITSFKCRGCDFRYIKKFQFKEIELEEVEDMIYR